MAISRKHFLLLAVLAGLTAGAILGAGSADAGASTKPSLNVGGKLYYDKKKAESSAVGRWGKQAAIKYGLQFSQWGQAKQKSVVCQFQTHKKNGRTLWSCRAIGRPFANIAASCKNHSIVAKNHRKNRPTAVKATRETWEKLVAIEFGVKYSFWKNAESRSTRCFKQGSGSAQEFECTLKAKPCH